MADDGHSVLALAGSSHITVMDCVQLGVGVCSPPMGSGRLGEQYPSSLQEGYGFKARTTVFLPRGLGSYVLRAATRQDPSLLGTRDAHHEAI